MLNFFFTHFLLLPIMHSISCFSFSTIIISKLELAHKQLFACFFTFSAWYCFTLIPCSEKVKLKNELVLSKCISYKSWSMTISRTCMKAWKLHLCLQWMFILTKQNWKFFLLFLVNCKTRFPLENLITII